TIGNKDVFVGALKNLNKYKTLSFSDQKLHSSLSMVVVVVVVGPNGSKIPNLNQACGLVSMQNILPRKSTKTSFYPKLYFESQAVNGRIKLEKGIYKIY
ncbi:MAG: hypothetical protein ACI920_003662, partial [Saprospiraceae bacterium]